MTKIFTAAGAIHIEHDEPCVEHLLAIETYVCLGVPIDMLFLIPIRKDGDNVRDARTGQELARRIGVITNIGA